MTAQTQAMQYPNNSMAGAFAGLLIGGLAGAVTMLLLAPQSGQETRSQIHDKSFELRDHAAKMLEDSVADLRSSAKKLTRGGQKRITELKHQGQELAVEQLDRVSAAVKAG